MNICKSHSRRSLKQALYVLSGISVITGPAGFLVGAKGIPGGGVPSPSFDSQFRFMTVWWFLFGPILLWSIRNLEARASVTRSLLGFAFLSGVGRFISYVCVGRPHGVFVAGLTELLVVPCLLAWHIYEVEGKQVDVLLPAGCVTANLPKVPR